MPTVPPAGAQPVPPGALALLDLPPRVLAAFCVVADTGSCAEAARRLFLSPSALSRQVAALEQALGRTLFERSSRGLTPTPLGELLLPHAEAALEALLRLHRVAAVPRQRR